MKEGVYLLCGEDDFLKRESEKAIISRLFGPGPKALNCDIYDARDGHKDIFNTLNTLPFLSDRRIVAIRDVEYLSESQKSSLLAYLKDPPRHVTLILESSLNASNNKFIRSVSNYAKTTQFRKLDRRRLREWIYNRLSKRRKSITKDALELLLELKGSDELSLLSSELEKLMTYIGEKRAISGQDVIELVGRSVARRAFDLIDAIGRKDRDAAVSIVRELSFDRRSIAQLIGLLGWQLRKAWKSGEGHFNREGLKRNFKLLVEADHSIKSGYSSPESVLEQLVMKLCRD